jgi:hypothetical protein
MLSRFSKRFVLDVSLSRARVTYVPEFYVPELSLGSLQEFAAAHLEVFRRRPPWCLGVLAPWVDAGCAGIERDCDLHRNVGRLHVLVEEAAAA